MRLSAPSTKRTARPAAIVSTKSATTALARAVARAATTGMMRKAAAALAAAMALRAAARRSGRIPARGGLSSTIRNRSYRPSRSGAFDPSEPQEENVTAENPRAVGKPASRVRPVRRFLPPKLRRLSLLPPKRTSARLGAVSFARLRDESGAALTAAATGSSAKTMGDRRWTLIPEKTERDERSAP
jgi:hypothetical protein